MESWVWEASHIIIIIAPFGNSWTAAQDTLVNFHKRFVKRPNSGIVYFAESFSDFFCEYPGLYVD